MTNDETAAMSAVMDAWNRGRVKELEVALSTAEADRKALVEVVRKARSFNEAWVNDRGEWSTIDGAFDGLSTALAALPAHLRSEAEGNGA